MLKTPLPAFAAALSLAALGTASAGAAEITYVDHDNVYVENLDGSQRHALSTDGTPARPYVLPTADEEGSLAAFQANATTGQQEIVYWAYGTGAPQRHLMPRSPGDTTTSPPTSARMQPDGATATLGYTFLAFGDPNQPRYGRSNPNSPSGADAQASIDYTDLTWFRERPVVARPEGTIYWTGASRVMLSPTEPGSKLTFAEISADGTRVLVRETLGDGSKRLALFSYVNDAPPYGDIDSGCALPIGAGFERGALSRDGKSVAWDDAAGVHVAQADPYAFDDDFTCTLSGSRLVSGTARMPAFSDATTTAPPAGGGTPPPGNGGTTPPPISTPPRTDTPPPPKSPSSTKSFKITLPTKIRAAALRRGLKLTGTAPAAGKLTVTLKRGSRTVASGSASARRAGTIKVTVKPRRGAKLNGKLKLTATFAPKSGKTSRKSATVKVA
ncbi:MAG TPA: hypothetical protein VFG42_06690 [Baekduia sp.]|uniref:hypothetical protein n=1 Tax=Baekduia sp. TaxID=2600305 RepID=UPI002D77EA8D|nr:hypothetical protein [Baekduia sp.]HET6506458.1 hypothetical protein [Baekduia sp.]